MQDLDELLRRLEEAQESQDRTVFISDLGDGRDFTSAEVIEHTYWRPNGLPETLRETRSKMLDCGHVPTKENPFAGLCLAKHGTFKKHICGKTSCAQCLAICSECGCTVSLGCHATLQSAEHILNEKTLSGKEPICERCHKKTRRKEIRHWIFALLISPFREDLTINNDDE